MHSPPLCIIQAPIFFLDSMQCAPHCTSFFILYQSHPGCNTSNNPRTFPWHFSILSRNVVYQCHRFLYRDGPESWFWRFFTHHFDTDNYLWISTLNRAIDFIAQKTTKFWFERFWANSTLTPISTYNFSLPRPFYFNPSQCLFSCLILRILHWKWARTPKFLYANSCFL